MPTIVFYVSGHGLGHASRQIEIMRALRRVRQDVSIVVKSSVPQWFFEQGNIEGVEFDPIEPDTGIVQIDSLQIDVEQSIDRCNAFHRTLDQRAAREADDLRSRGTTLVVGDIPPLACIAGSQASVPTVAIGNFTWDWIYSSYPETTERAPTLVQTLASAYASATAAWRLPLHGGFAAFKNVVDVPMVARHSSRHPKELRKRLRLPSDQRLVLFAFGRYGIGTINWPHVDQLSGYHIVFTSNDSWGGGPKNNNCTTLDEATLAASGIAYEDLMAAVDVVITKPGFGMVTECAANDTAMLYTDRGRFPEYGVLVSGMSALIRSAHIDQEDLFALRWQKHLDNLLTQRRPSQPNLTGAFVIGNKLARLLD